MLSKKEILKMERKLSENKLNGISPSTKTELAKQLGFSRQLLNMICNIENKSKNAELKVRAWINDVNLDLVKEYINSFLDNDVLDIDIMKNNFKGYLFENLHTNRLCNYSGYYKCLLELLNINRKEK